MAKKSVKSHEMIAQQMPGFAADSSLAKSKQHYALGQTPKTDTGSVIPQGLFVGTNGHLWYCYNEGGFSGCIDLGSRTRTLM